MALKLYQTLSFSTLSTSIILLYLTWIASLSTLQLIQKSIIWKHNAGTKLTIFLNYHIKSKNGNIAESEQHSMNWTALEKLTLCWWLSLLFSDDVQNRLLSVKQNIFHTHHLTTPIENTIRHKQHSSTYFNWIGNKTISSGSKINTHSCIIHV